MKFSDPAVSALMRFPFTIVTENESIKKICRLDQASTLKDHWIGFTFTAFLATGPIVLIFMAVFMGYELLSEVFELPVIVHSEGQVQEVSTETSNLIFGLLSLFSASVWDFILRKKYKTKIFLFFFLPMWLCALIFLGLILVLSMFETA